MAKIPVGVLGATGAVGQRFVQLLQNHPWFELTELAASDKSAGKRYEAAVKQRGGWYLDGDMPDAAKRMIVKNPSQLECRVVFSALDSDVAGPVEEKFAIAGFFVSSNSKNHRMDEEVPLIIPEVNPDHLELIRAQQAPRFRVPPRILRVDQTKLVPQKRWTPQYKGVLITNPNCTTVGLVLSLKPLMDEYGIKKVYVTSLQALSGAGYPGVSAYDITDNVIPFIPGEEAKVMKEPLKILGMYSPRERDPPFASIRNADIQIVPMCNRVAALDAHLETVTVILRKKAKSVDEVVETFTEFNPLRALQLPSSPEQPIIYRPEQDGPQPRKDRMAGNGMSATVGTITLYDDKRTLTYRVLSHNTIRGAAGAAMLNAELALKMGYLK